MSIILSSRLTTSLNLSKNKVGQVYRRTHGTEQYQAGKNDLPGFLSLGFASGALGSLLGLGGAFVALPVMTGHFNMPQGMAHGTSIAVVLATSLGACYSYAKRINLEEIEVTNKSSSSNTFFGIPEVVGSIHVVNAASLALTSTVMVVFGAMLSKRLPGSYLKLIHGTMMVVCAPLIPFQSLFKEDLKVAPALTLTNCNTTDIEVVEATAPKYEIQKVIRPMLIGVVTGTLAGMLGVGGGIIMVPALNFFTDMDFQQSLGTSLAGEYTNTHTLCMNG